MGIDAPIDVARTVPASATALAERFRARVAEAGDEIERLCRLPDDLAHALKAAGAFRLLIPAEHGGSGAELPDFLDALEIFAMADASTAWCISQGAVIATTSLWLPEQSIAELWRDPLCTVANGPPRGASLTPTGETYRLTGRWGFSSGSAHATWMHGAARRTDGAWFGVYFPRSLATFHDNWRVAGLRGTSSVEFSVDDLPLAAEWIADFRKPPRTEHPLYRLPTGLVFAVSFASVALGVARAGLDDTLALAREKVPGYANAAVKDDADMQRLVGEAETRWRAARAYLHAATGEVWRAIAHQSRIEDAQRVALRMAGTHTIREATAVMDLAYSIAGSTAIYQGHPLQRRYQDAHVISQHVQGRLGHYGHVGRYFLGHGFEPGPLN